MTAFNLFEEQCKKTPEAIAVQYGTKVLNFSQLHNEVVKLSAYLNNLGAGKGNFIGVSLQRSIEMVIALLAITKTGAAYLPLDPSFPSDRLKFMLEDSSCSMLLTEESLIESFNYYKGKLIDIKEYKNFGLNNHSETANFDENDLAYLLYTSGSTGKPKGVQITHRGLVNFLLSMKYVPGMTESDSLLAVTTLSFDISGLEIYLPLITGAKLVIASGDEVKDGNLLLKKLMDNISVMQCTPSTWKMLIDSGWNEKLKLKALCGGEELTRDLADKLLERVDSLWNMYGPTETTIWSSAGQVLKNSGPIYLGRPIRNTQFYIVDKNNQLCPPGVPGELLIGGDGLSAGYLNRNELTEEKFIPDPFNKENKGRLYRTGDLVKLTFNKEIEFLGRIDSQVKIRGFRIELGEIESIIRKNLYVQDCVAVVKEFKDKDKRIIAYFISKKNSHGRNYGMDENVNTWRTNWDDIYNRAIDKTKETKNKNTELGYLVVEQFEHNNNYREQYNVWIDQTTERIKGLKHNKVLEIGCGGGDILKRIALECEFYAAVDLSEAVIKHLDEELKNSDKKYPEIQLFAQPADSDLPFAAKSFDIIILNSIIQYFPNKEYLVNVINKKLNLLSDDGCLFIGDVQSYSLMQNFNLHEQLNYIAPEEKINDLKQIVNNKVRIEPEFFIDPEFFYSLSAKDKRISRVEIKPIKGSVDNEPSVYHYDVFIYSGKSKVENHDIKVILWDDKTNDFSEINQILKNEKPEILYCGNIPNKRIGRRNQIENLIEKADPGQTVSEVLNSFVFNSHDIDPEEIWALENEDYSVELVIPKNSDQLHFDAVFISKKSVSNSLYPIRDANQISDPLKKICNDPSFKFYYRTCNFRVKNRNVCIITGIYDTFDVCPC